MRGSFASILAQNAASENGDTTFFTQFIVSGGPIVWFILLPMSVITVYLILDFWVNINRRRLLPKTHLSLLSRLVAQTEPEVLPSRLKKHKDLVSLALIRTIEKSQSMSVETSDLHTLAAEALHEQGLRLQRKVEWSSIIGNVAPMVGLFGTVFGMIKAFNILGVAQGQPRPDQLAAAISIALITTFWGLLVAIPALAVHGIYSAKIEAFVSEASIEIELLLQQLSRKDGKTGTSVSGGRTADMDSSGRERPISSRL